MADPHVPVVHHPDSLVATCLALAVVAAILGSAIPLAAGSPAPSASTPRSPLAVMAARSTGPHPQLPVLQSTLSVNASSVNLSSLFWGVTVNNEVRMFRGETAAVNATPARVLVWPGAMAGEDYDPLTDTHYDTYSGVPIHALTDEAQFVQLCRATHCTAVVQVPAEIDDPQIAEAIVNYTEVNLSFTPAYWMIGNEPELWEHWQVPWNDWETTYTAGPTPTQFGQEVVKYVKAIRAVDPTTPILGLPASGCTCGYWTFPQWIAGVLNVTGDLIQAVAFHEYPAGWLGTGDGSLLDFYQTIQGAASIPVRIAAARTAVESSCPGCNVSVWVSELGSALSWSDYGQYAIGFSGALSLGSQLTQAMDENVSNVDLFATELATTNSWFSPTGQARPDYQAYTEVFDHLGTEAFPVNMSGLNHTVYAIDTIAPHDQGRRDLLVLNDNITNSVEFSPQFAEGLGNAPVLALSWNGSIQSTESNGTTWVEPYTPNPVPTEFPNGLPANYTLPPQSLVLFEAYPARATYVQVREDGVPNGTAWYFQMGSRSYETNANNISLLVPAGSYAIGSVGIPLPIDGRERYPTEQLGPFVRSPFTVGGAYANATVNFVDQWRVNVTASPAGSGTVTPGAVWWNDSEPLNLSVVAPAPGYAFAGWSGWGPGAANGTLRTIQVDPTGGITERARFVVGDPVWMVEGGLPDNTTWSVTVRGFTTNSTDNNLTLYEPVGSYGYNVTPEPGYRAVPKDGGFLVNSNGAFVAVRFVALTPPAPRFPVTFQISGLPSVWPVSIAVRGTIEVGGIAAATFLLSNGTYGYRVGYEPGYHAVAGLKTFEVAGGPLTVNVEFVPTVYRVLWTPIGSRAWMNWSVAVNGTTLWGGVSGVSTTLENGTYAYRIDVPSNFSATPPTGVFLVEGSAPRVSPVFSLLEFAARFAVGGPEPTGPWTVRLGNSTLTGTNIGTSFLEANGTYTFDVHPPSGEFAVPSHGNLTVAGTVPPQVIQFYPTSEKPSAALIARLTAGVVWVSVWIGGAGGLAYLALGRVRHRARHQRN
jgi:hypothetical protein